MITIMKAILLGQILPALVHDMGKGSLEEVFAEIQIDTLRETNAPNRSPISRENPRRAQTADRHARLPRKTPSNGPKSRCLIRKPTEFCANSLIVTCGKDFRWSIQLADRRITQRSPNPGFVTYRP